ncbi:MAG: hypothetical protein U9R19_08135 [Bacteroidota bacterium]|nr:hypothetical protein [Bacteroidota bacterium]
MDRLLAIDLGVKTGLALFNRIGELEWYRSQNYGNRNRLSRAAYSILNNISGLSLIVIEGGGSLYKIWRKEAIRAGIGCKQIHAHEWRGDILFCREQRNCTLAKHNAIRFAKIVIDKCGQNKSTSLTDDAAEAILTGYWFMKKTGWCTNKLGPLR